MRATAALLVLVVGGTLLATVATGATGQTKVLRGTAKDDKMVGTARGEKMYGFAGDDWLRGLGGNDTLVGGPGADTLSGGPGHDLIVARDGVRDVIFCGLGKDRAVVDLLDAVYRDCETVRQPPAAPPESRTDCAVSNYTTWTWEQCKPGTVIRVTNEPWHCRKPLATFGKLPIKVISTSTGSWSDIAAVSVNSGCVGAEGDDVNLIVEIRGDGPHSPNGPGADAFKTRVDPRNLRITGSFQCSRRVPSAHQDALQIQGGTDIVFVNVEGGGDYDAGTSTCQGAGGGPFYSLNDISNVDIVGGKWIGCNHALNGAHGGSENDVIGAKFRSGRTDGSDANCSEFHSSPPCVRTWSLRLKNVSCQEWRDGRWVAVSPR